VKPDQLIKRRGKLGLIKAGADLAGVQQWLTEKLGKDFQVRTFTWILVIKIIMLILLFTL